MRTIHKIRYGVPVTLDPSVPLHAFQARRNAASIFDRVSQSVSQPEKRTEVLHKPSSSFTTSVTPTIRTQHLQRQVTLPPKKLETRTAPRSSRMLFFRKHGAHSARTTEVSHVSSWRRHTVNIPQRLGATPRSGFPR